MPNHGSTVAFLSGRVMNEARRLPTALCVVPARRHAAGMEVVRQGEVAFDVFLIAAGSVKISNVFSDGRNTIIGLAGPGAILGASAALLEVPHGHSVVTLGHCMLHRIAADVFRRAVEHDPEVSRHLHMQDASQRHELERHIVSVNCLTARERLMVMLSEAMDASAEQPGFAIETTPPLRDWELAQLVGVTPQYLSLLLHELAVGVRPTLKHC